MSERPELTKGMDSETFRSYYYLKEELTEFCRKNGLPVSGGKKELSNRIAHFLDTGSVLPPSPPRKRAQAVGTIEETERIESDFVCTEKHRAFFREHIGSSFSFNVPFQKWLRANAGKTYGEAIEAYYELLQERKREKPQIESQFEYNTYIRDFFADNEGKSLKDAIACWKYKKSLPGHNRYERSDVAAVKSLTGKSDS